MEFDIGTKTELGELIKFRMNKEVDEEYVRLLMEIINSSSLFSEKIIAKKNNSTKSLAVDLENNNLYYNLEGFKKRHDKMYRNDKKNQDLDLKQFYNYWLSFLFFHEISHVYQILCDRDSFSEYVEVNNLYREILGAFRKFRNIDSWKYTILHNKYCLERYANIFAGNMLKDIFEGTEFEYYSKLVQINCLFGSSGYYQKKDKVISPVERTFRYLRIPYDVGKVDLPFKVLFEHGFEISDEDFQFIYFDVLKGYTPLNYDINIGRIKALIKRDNL